MNPLSDFLDFDPITYNKLFRNSDFHKQTLLQKK